MHADGRETGQAVNARRWKTPAALLLLGTVIGLAIWLRARDFAASAESLHAWIEAQPLAPLVFVAVLVLRPFLLLPSWMVMTAGGALFGIVEGSLLCSIGGLLSGGLVFALARALGRPTAERLIGARLRRVDAALRDRGAGVVAAYTAFPATPLAVAQIALGLSAMRPGAFLLATLCGMLPRTVLLAWLGDALMRTHWLQAATAFAILLALVAVGWKLRRTAPAASAAPDAGADDPGARG